MRANLRIKAVLRNTSDHALRIMLHTMTSAIVTMKRPLHIAGAACL